MGKASNKSVSEREVLLTPRSLTPPSSTGVELRGVATSYSYTPSNPLPVADASYIRVPAAALDASYAKLTEEQGSKESVEVVSSFYSAGSIEGSVFNLASATVGAGALSLPFAFKISGALTGSLLLIFAAVVTVYSIFLLIKTRDLTGYKSYEEMALNLFGPRFAVLVEVSVFLFCFGALVAYLICIGDIIAPLADKLVAYNGSVWDSVFHSRSLVLTMYVMCIVLPLSLLEKVNSLRFTSLLGVVSICYLIFAISCRSVGHLAAGLVQWSEVNLTRTTPDLIFRCTSMVVFAYSCQTNVLSIYEELSKRSEPRMRRVTLWSMGIALTLYLLVGLFGYLLFVADTDGNILNNFGPTITSDIALAFGELAMTFALVLAFPLSSFPCRWSIEAMLDHGHNSHDQHPSSPRAARRTYARAVLITVLIVVSSLALAIVAPGINTVFELLGGIVSGFVCFMLPGMYYLKVAPGDVNDNLMPIFLVIGGFAVGLISTMCTLSNLL